MGALRTLAAERTERAMAPWVMGAGSACSGWQGLSRTCSGRVTGRVGSGSGLRKLGLWGVWPLAAQGTLASGQGPGSAVYSLYSLRSRQVTQITCCVFPVSLRAHY